VSAKAKKKPTTPLAVTLTPLAAFAEPVALGATITAVSGPPTVTLAYWKGLITTLAIKPLAREVAVLPLSRLVPLKDAFKLASDRLGSYSLAAQDLAQRARIRQLLVVAQVIGRDGSKRVFLLRSKFWQWFRIVWSSPRPDEGRPDLAVGVDIRTLGRWHFFVGRRRLDRFYPAVSSDKPETRSSTSEVSTVGSRSVLRQQTGPKTARRWQDHVLREQYRAASEGRPLLTGPELADSCTEHLGVEVDVSDINKFLKKAREEL
jgi:hypothetical protein